MKKKNLIKKGFANFNLQFFADNPENEENENDDDFEEDEEEKTFTQDQVTRISAREKKQGRKSAYRDLGFNSEKEAKEEMESYRQWKKSQKTPEELKAEELKTANENLSSAEKRALDAEMKLSVFMAGVKKEAVEDVLAIARLKVTDDKDLDSVLSEMKTQERYNSFFVSENDEGSKGTGSSLNHHKKEQEKENIGKRLALKNAEQKKSSYFSN